MIELNRYIDHTLLKPDACPEDILQLCSDARTYDFVAVCVNSSYVYLAHQELKDCDVRVSATVGFPLGAANTKSKVSEAKQAIKEGADEIDMVLNIGFSQSRTSQKCKGRHRSRQRGY